MLVDDIARQLKRIQASNFYRSNTLRINLTEAGGLSVSPMVGDTNREFSRLEDAEAYIQQYGLTSSERVQPSRGYLGGSTATQTAARHFERGIDLTDVSVGAGGWVEEQHFRFDDPSQLESFRQIYNPRPGQFMGFPNIDENKATLLRFFTPEGVELEHHQASEAVFRTRGWQQNVPEPGGKVGKRLKGMLTQRIYEMESNNPIRVGLIDAQSELDMKRYREQVRSQIDRNVRAELGVSDEFDSPGFRAMVENQVDEAERVARQRAVDGFSEISEEGARKVQEFIETQARELASENERLSYQIANAGAEEYPELLRQQQELTQSEQLLRRRAGELSEFIENRSGVFNIRALGLELENIHGVDISHLWAEDERMRGFFELKGNVTITDNPYMRSHNVDIVTDVSNITRQGGIPPESGGRITLNPFSDPSAPVEYTRWDAQTASSYPEFMDTETIRFAKERVKAEVADMAERVSRGEVPDELKSMLRAQASSPELMEANEAQHALDYIERGGSLADDPGLARRVLRTYHGENVNLQRAVGKKLQQKGLSGEPLYQMPMPDTIRGEITPRQGMQHAVPAEELPEPGQLRYSKAKGAWIMHESDAGLFHYSLGGFDFDDMVNNMIRFNPEARTLEGSIEGLVYRQPNVRGEWARLSVDPTDYSVRHILEREGVYDNFQGMFQARERSRQRLEQAQTAAEQAEYSARVRRAETSIRRLLEQNLHHVPEGVDDVPMRYGERMLSGHTLGRDPIYTYEGEPFGNYMQPRKDAPQWGAIRPWEMSPEERTRQARRTIDVLENFVGGESGLVGMYSNARMVRDHWVANQQGVLGQAPIRAGLEQIMFEHEDVIDAYAQGASRHPTAGAITESAEGMIESVYRGATYLAGHGYDVEDVGVDPVLQQWKGGGFSAAAQRGIEQGVADVEGEGINFLRTPTVDDLLMSQDSERATLSAFYNTSMELGEHQTEVERNIRQPSWVRDVPGLTGDRATDDARRIIEAAKRADETSFEFVRQLPEETARRTEALRMGQADFMSDVVDMFEEGQAGERVNRAILRAQQLAEQEGMPQGFTDRMAERLRNAGLTDQANKWGRVQAGLDDAESLANMPTVSAYDVYHDIGTTTRGGPGVDETIGRILYEQGTERTPSQRALEDLTKGIDFSSRRGDIDLTGAPERIQRLFEAQEGRAAAMPGRKLRGPLDPDLPVSVPIDDLRSESVTAPEDMARRAGQRRTVRRMGELLEQSLRSFESGAESPVDKHIADAVTEFYEASRQWAATPGLEAYDAMPTEMRAGIERSMEGSDVFPATDHGREAARKASSAATDATEVVSTGKYSRLTQEGISNMVSGRGGLIGGALAVAAGLVMYRRGNRDPDYTENHMQGPSTLTREPAPYTSLERQLIAQRSANDPMESNVRGPGNDGATIDMDTQDSLSDDFLRNLSQVLGGTVNASERSPSARTQMQQRDERTDEALRSY